MSDLQCPVILLVIRHGESESNVARRISAALPGPPLTGRGRGQAREVAQTLLARNVARIYASPLLRAQQTGAELAAVLGAELQTLDDVREFALGAVEDSARPEDIAEVDAVFLRWLDGELDASVAGGESGIEIIDRMRAALQGVADLHRGETVVVVSHGGVMGLALPLLAGRPALHAVRDKPLANVSVVELAVDADGWRMVSWPTTAPRTPYPGDVVDLLGRADAERNRGMGEHAEVGGALCAHFELPFAWSTQAAFTAFADPPDRDQLDAAVRWLQERSPHCWELVVRADQRDAVAALAPITLVTSQTHGVWMCASAPPDDALPDAEIGPARDADEVLAVYGAELEPLVRGRIGVAGDEFLVARDRGGIVACARVRSLGGTAYISAVTVAPAARGRGLGRAISVAATHLGLHREPIAWLHCDDAVSGLYAALGYQRVTTHVHLAPSG